MYRRSPRAKKHLVHIFDCPVPKGMTERCCQCLLERRMLEQGFARCGELLWHWTVNPKDFSDRRRTLRIRGVFVGVDVARAKPTFANILVVAQHQPGTKVVKVDLRDGVAVQVPPRAADCPVDHCPGA